MHGWGMGAFGMGFPMFGIVPLVFFGAGIYFLFRHRGVFDRISGNRRGADDDTRLEGVEHPAPVTRVFRLARARGGVLTVSDVVSELDLALGDAESLLDELSDGLRVQMTVDDDGIVRYIFREFRE